MMEIKNTNIISQDFYQIKEQFQILEIDLSRLFNTELTCFILPLTLFLTLLRAEKIRLDSSSENSGLSAL